jgi:chemotaxis protein MotB
LDQLIEYLRTSADTRLIRVEGHTDNVEIGPSLKSRYPSNWELAKARANGVVRYLVEKGGLDSARLSAVGYGDSKPAVTNASEEGRTKNRRVEILLYNPDTESTDSKLDGNNQAQQTKGDSSDLSARGSNDQLAAPPNASSPSGSGTFSVGEQRQAPPGGGTSSSDAYGSSGSGASGSESRTQTSASGGASGGDGSAPATNPSTGNQGSSDPAKQDPMPQANVPGF